MADHVLLMHWALRINARNNLPKEEFFSYLADMEDIIDDVPPSYHQQTGPAETQNNYLVNLLEREWKEFVQWVYQYEKFEMFAGFCHRIWVLFAKLYDEVVEEGELEDDVIPTEEEEELEEIESENGDSSDVESHEDQEGPPSEFENDMSPNEPWIQRTKKQLKKKLLRLCLFFFSVMLERCAMQFFFSRNKITL